MDGATSVCPLFAAASSVVVLTANRIVLRVWRNRQEVPGVAGEEPPGPVSEDMVTRFVTRSFSLRCYRAKCRSADLKPPPPPLPSLAEALVAATAAMSVEAQKRAAKDAMKKTAKAEAAEQKHASLLAKSIVTVKRIERNKRKFVTSVSGLEAFGLELKKVSKEFGKKFATGSSVTKTPSGGEEIVVQGDVSDEIKDFLLEKYKDIPEDNVELVDDKAKKKAAAAAAGAS